jgi:hypothetical protein
MPDRLLDLMAGQGFGQLLKGSLPGIVSAGPAENAGLAAPTARKPCAVALNLAAMSLE